MVGKKRNAFQTRELGRALGKLGVAGFLTGLFNSILIAEGFEPFTGAPAVIIYGGEFIGFWKLATVAWQEHGGKRRNFTPPPQEPKH